MAQATHLYAVAIGSNRRHGCYGRPTGVVAAAIAHLDAAYELFDASPIMLTRAAHGAGRDFANAVALVRSALDPATMLASLKAIEREFGRRPGKRWRERVLDLDLAAWSGARIVSRRLTLPHPRLQDRDFVLVPLMTIAPDWPIAGPIAGMITARHLASRLGKRRRLV